MPRKIEVFCYMSPPNGRGRRNKMAVFQAENLDWYLTVVGEDMSVDWTVVAPVSGHAADSVPGLHDAIANISKVLERALANGSKYVTCSRA